MGMKGEATCLHLATEKGSEKIVKLLLNVFQEKEQLIEYLMKIDTFADRTALHFASYYYSGEHQENIVELLLNAFGRVAKEKLIEHFLMKEDRYGDTVLHNASEKLYEIII